MKGCLATRWHSNRKILATGLAALPMLFSGIVFADDEEERIEEIVVTGSYIKSSPADSPSPLSVITSADIENNHTVDMNELLTRLPYQSGGYIQAATFTGGGFQGRLPINLRNLGDAATLPLVNGKRHLPAFVAPLGDSTVDVNSMIPQIMIDRVEIVKDGSSALYGSDAVAGVVNFITKKNFEGVEIDTRFVTDEATSSGDEISTSIVIGSQGDRGGFTMAMEFLDRNEISTENPEVYAFQGGFGVSGTGNPGRFLFANDDPLLFADGTAVPEVEDADGDMNKLLPRVLNPDVANAAHWGAADLNCNDAAKYDGIGGTLGAVPSGGIDNQICAIDYGNFFSIQEGETLQKFYATGYYDLSDDVEIYFEGGYAEQQYFRPNSLAPQTRAPAIPTHHFGLIEDARRRGITPTSLISIVRLQGGTRDLTGSFYRPADTLQYRDGDTMRGVIGIDADLQFGERDWNLNASFTWSEQSMDMKREEDSRANELVRSIHGLGGPNCNPYEADFDTEAMRGEGNISYADTGNFDDGKCYYYNPFGNALFTEGGAFIDGNMTNTKFQNPPELVNWLVGGQNELDEVEQRVIDVVLAGEAFDLPSGPVGMAFGLQVRHDDLDKDYDVNTNANNAAFRYGAADVRADMTSKAVFAEINAPVLDTVDLQIAVRHERFNELNTSTTDPKISAIWRPDNNWSVRGSWGTSFRVGGLMQLFGTQTIVSNTEDPYLDTEFFIPWISSGNVGLQPEESEAWNIGVSFQGDEGLLDGWSANIDVWNYDYENLLSKESAPALLEADGLARLGADGKQGTADDCYDASCGANPSQVIRNTTYNPVRVLPNFINANNVQVSGIDLDVGYDIATDAGLFGFTVATAWIQKYDATTDDGTTEAVGSLNQNTIVARALPEFKTNVTASWTKDRHSVFVMTRFIDGVENDRDASSYKSFTRPMAMYFVQTGEVGFGPENPEGSTLQYELDDSWKKDLDETYWTDIYYNYSMPAFGVIPEGGVVSLGIRNAFNERVEPVPNAAGFDGTIHDARGRMYMLRYRLSLL